MFKPPSSMSNKHHKTVSDLIPEPDRQILTDSYENRHGQDLMPEGVTSNQFVGMIFSRIRVELAHELKCRVHEIADADVEKAYVSWVDQEIHLAQEFVPINIDSQNKYSEVRTKIVQEIAAKAVLLFSRWQGVQSSFSIDKENLRSQLWKRLPPEVPAGASSVTIMTESESTADKMKKLIRAKIGNTAECDKSTITIPFSGPEFAEIWKICVELKIPPRSLTF